MIFVRRTLLILASVFIQSVAFAWGQPQATRSARIISEPLGAKVRINGTVLGLTPLYNVMIPVGKVRIQMEIEGDERYSQIDVKEIVEESRETLVIDKHLPERNAYIDLDVKPKDAEVILNGILVDQDKRDRIPVPIRKELYLLINAPRHDKEDIRIPALAPDQVYSLDVKLKPEPCQVYITSNPSFAEVRLNGSVLGNTPLDYRFPPGEYELEVEKEQYDAQEIELSCERGQHLDRAVFLVRAKYSKEEKAFLASAEFWRKASIWTFSTSLALGVASYWQFTEFEKLDQQYTAATLPVDIEDFRQRREAAKSLSSSLAISSGVGLGLSYLFYRWGIVPEELLNRPSYGIASQEGGFYFAWHLRW